MFNTFYNFVAMCCSFLRSNQPVFFASSDPPAGDEKPMAYQAFERQAVRRPSGELAEVRLANGMCQEPRLNGKVGWFHPIHGPMGSFFGRDGSNLRSFFFFLHGFLVVFNGFQALWTMDQTHLLCWVALRGSWTYLGLVGCCWPSFVCIAKGQNLLGTDLGEGDHFLRRFLGLIILRYGPVLKVL